MWSEYPITNQWKWQIFYYNYLPGFCKWHFVLFLFAGCEWWRAVGANCRDSGQTSTLDRTISRMVDCHCQRHCRTPCSGLNLANISMDNVLKSLTVLQLKICFRIRKTCSLFGTFSIKCCWLTLIIGRHLSHPLASRILRPEIAGRNRRRFGHHVVGAFRKSSTQWKQLRRKDRQLVTMFKSALISWK